MRTAIYAGSFDPLTNGHLDLIKRASRIFDKLVVAVGSSPEKEYMFSLDQRVAQVTDACTDLGNIEVVRFSGLLAKFVESHKATAIIRGLRAVSDFEYEFQMALMNRELARDVETVFLMPSLKYVYLSSSIVKDVALNGGDVSRHVPECVHQALKTVFAERKNR